MTKNWSTQIPIFASLILLSYAFLKTALAFGGIARYTWIYEKLITRGVAYQDFFLEYPTGFASLLYLAKLLEVTVNHFPYFYWSLAAGASLLSFFFLHQMVRDYLSDRDFVIKALLIVLFFSPVFLSYYDIFPVFATILATYLLLRERYNLSFIFLGIGALLKYYPLMLVPPFALYLLRRGVKSRRILSSFTLLILTLILFSAVGVATLGWQSVILPAKFFLERGLHVETTVGAVLALFPRFDISYNGHFFQIAAPAWVSFAIPIISLLALGIYLISSVREMAVKPDNKAVVKNTLLVLLILILTSKVFSPQLLLWIFPFVILFYAYTKNSRIFWLYILILALTDLFLFSPIYFSLIGYLRGGSHLLAAVLINVRNAVLAFYTIYAWKQGRRNSSFADTKAEEVIS